LILFSKKFQGPGLSESFHRTLPPNSKRPWVFAISSDAHEKTPHVEVGFHHTTSVKPTGMIFENIVHLEDFAAVFFVKMGCPKKH
jgi:hypothetical protein